MGKVMAERDEPGALPVVMVEAIEVVVAVFRVVAVVRARAKAMALAVVRVVVAEDEAKLVVEAKAAFAEVVRQEDERHLALRFVVHH